MAVVDDLLPLGDELERSYTVHVRGTPAALNQGAVLVEAYAVSEDDLEIAAGR